MPTCAPFACFADKEPNDQFAQRNVARRSRQNNCLQLVITQISAHWHQIHRKSPRFRPRPPSIAQSLEMFRRRPSSKPLCHSIVRASLCGLIFVVPTEKPEAAPRTRLPRSLAMRGPAITIAIGSITVVGTRARITCDACRSQRDTTMRTALKLTREGFRWCQALFLPWLII